MTSVIIKKNMFSVLFEEAEVEQAKSEQAKSEQAKSEQAKSEQAKSEQTQVRGFFKGRNVVPLKKEVKVTVKSEKSQSANTPKSDTTKFVVATTYLDHLHSNRKASTSASTSDNKYTKACTRCLLQQNGQYGVCTKVNCSFAHSLDELKDRICRFDTRCKNNTCSYKHSNETRVQWCSRTKTCLPALPEFETTPRSVAKQPVEYAQFSEPVESTQFSEPVESTQFSEPVEYAQFSEPVESTQFSEPVESAQFSEPVFIKPNESSVFTEPGAFIEPVKYHQLSNNQPPEHVITVPSKELAEIAVKCLISQHIYNFRILIG
jgi:hypothetical protein